jgi:hypothetical protein
MQAAGPPRRELVGHVSLSEYRGGISHSASSGAMTPASPVSSTASPRSTDAWIRSRHIECALGRSKSVTPSAATQSPQPLLPMRPARSNTGKPGRAVARMSP